MKPDSLWERVGNECLEKALTMLDGKAVLSAEEAEAVRVLVETAIAVDRLDLSWASRRAVAPWDARRHMREE